MKKLFLNFVSVILLICCISAFPANADTHNVFDIDIDVKIHSNGNATVIQKWYGTFTDGTENYLPIGNFAEGMDISDFKVWDENTEYEYIDDWDINASLEEKRTNAELLLLIMDMSFASALDITEKNLIGFLIK